MDVVIRKTAEEASSAAARAVAKLLRQKPAAVLGLTGGRSPMIFYRELVRIHREEGLSFHDVTTFNVDEYAGVDRSHPAAFARELDTELIDIVNIKKANTFMPKAGEEKSYEDLIRKVGGIDIQFLGVGADGHLGFNSPGTMLGARTHVTPLSKQSFTDAGAKFKKIGPTPRLAITMGMATIQDARCIIMLAFGANKARAVAEMIEGSVSAMWPASALQLHRSVKVFLDEPAASQLKHREHHEFLQAAREAGA